MINLNERLSANFTLGELVKSQTAARLGIDNTPSERVINNLKNLVKNVLQPLRSKLGRVVSVSSCYRSVELNKAIGGASTSDHIEGFAADIEVFGMSNKALFEFIKREFKFTQLILEFYDPKDESSGWVHVSYNPDDLRCECLIAIKVEGRTKYIVG